MMNRQIRVKIFLVQLNALLHVTQSKFNPCKREIVCLAYSFGRWHLFSSGHILLAS